MVMSILGLGILLLVGYTWMIRGFLSSLLNLVCVVVAGAIAFGVWEYVAYFLLEASPTRGFTNFIGSMAWTLALGGTFAIALAILRFATDSVVRNNAPTGKMGDYIGGGLCGLLSGVIIAGVSVISLGMLRLDTDMFGARNFVQYKQGNVVRESSMWVPVDSWTAGLYGHLSRCAFASDGDLMLAEEYSTLADLPSTMRMSAGDGMARNWMAPGSAKVESRYTVGDGKLPLRELLVHYWADKAGNINKEEPQTVMDIDGKPFEDGATIEGFLVTFNAGAKESTAQMVVGNAQVRLAVRDDDGDAKDLYPIAAVVKANAADLQFARFCFNSDKLFVTSAGADATAKFGFEFVVPAGYSPKSLYVKGVRLDVSDDSMKPRLFKTPRDRDNTIVDGSLMGSKTTQTLSGSAAVSSGASDSGSAVTVKTASGGLPEGVRITNQMPFVIQRGSENGIEVLEDKKNTIRSGEMSLDAAMLRQGQSAESNLRIDRLEMSKDVNIVQLDVGPSAATSLLGKSASMAADVAPPFLVDTNGSQYQAVGYFYQDGDVAVIRYTPDDPIRGRSQLPRSLTRSRNDQKATFIFRVSAGVKIAEFRLGNKVVATFTPFLVDQPRG
jgi:uncharacterized membrane protein required for colicin V production